MFEVAQRGQGLWKGIHLEAVTDSTLEYVNVSGGTVGIAMTKSTPKIGHCILANNATGMSIGDCGCGSNPTIDHCIVSFNLKDGLNIRGSDATITCCTITKNGDWGINGVYYASPKVSKSIITLNRGGGVWCRQYECRVGIGGSVICDNGSWDIKNESALEWDLRGNYWGRVTAALRAGKGVVSVPNIVGKVRMDEFVKSPPKDCGAGKSALWGQKLW